MAGRIRQPVRRGVAKVPFVMQLETLECGAACLCMILAYYRKWIPLEQMRLDCGVSRDGSNAQNLLKAARRYGLAANGYRFEPAALRESGSFPCIIHWNFNHFVVLNGFCGEKAYLTDPAQGTYSVSMEDFDESFTGICLLFDPSESFTPSGKPKSVLSFAARQLRGTGAALAFTALTAVIAAMIGLIQPAFSRFFLDRLLIGQNPEWTLPFLILLGVFDLVCVLMSAMESFTRLRINGKMAVAGTASYMWKLMKLPLNFFSQRMAGDLQMRQKDNAAVVNTLLGTAAPLLLHTLMMILYFSVMLRYSRILTAAGLVSLAVSAIVSGRISKMRTNLTRISLRDQARLASASVAGIEMIETIKASGAENGFFRRWSGYQANANTQKVKFLKLNQYLGMIPTFISALADDLVLLLGVWLTMQGHFTVGMILAFQGFLTSFMSPALTLVSAGETLQEMRTQMERIDDVMEYPEEDVFADKPANVEYRKLSGHLELRDVVFGYSTLAEPFIRGLSLTLEPGKTVALVGASGCGKSTVSKLISGLYRPWSGEILFDGKPMREIDHNVFHGSLAAADQDVILFEDTVANNIKMWDDSIEDFEMILAARDAQIHDDILQRPLGYQYRLAEGGRDFSGGERQRIEIARVLAQDPTVLLLDEATSALDAKTEHDVMKAIRDRGIACLVIAHRLSAIRSCDEILVMDQGVICDRGTHAELMKKCALYRELVFTE